MRERGGCAALLRSCRRTDRDFLQDEENDPHFEPVIKLTEQVETKTGEEDEDVLFKMYAVTPRLSTNKADCIVQAREALPL